MTPEELDARLKTELPALAANVKRLVLSHVSARYSISGDDLAKEAREVFENVTVAKDGMTIEVPFEAPL